MCRKCGKNIEITEVYRTTLCPACGADLHSCVNCRFYSPESHYGCRENVQEPVSDKERANFCDFFSVNRNGFAVRDEESEAVQKARSAFDALFGN